MFHEVVSPSRLGTEKLLSLRMERGLVDHHALGGKMIPPAYLVGYKRVIPGQIVMNRMRAAIGVFGLAHEEGIVSPDYAVLSCSDEVVADYYLRLFKTPQAGSIFRIASKGMGTGHSGFMRLYTDQFGRVTVPFPRKDEQAAIVRYLTHATRQIDSALSEKRRVLALLSEQKQAIIHRAVTRGLDPDVPLKPSGIPWLGDIPQHWEVSRTKNEFDCLNSRRIPLSSTERGKMTSRTFDYYGASGVIDKVEDYIFDDDLLLVAEDGANLVLRNLKLAIIARGKFWVNNHAHILKPKRGNIEYLQAVMESIDYRPWITGSAQPKLTKDRLLAISIAVAPCDQQHALVKSFTEETRPLTTAIARTEREIALMQEYRTRLTADVVTGKLDIRAAAASLPTDTDEPVPIALDTDGDDLDTDEDAGE